MTWKQWWHGLIAAMVGGLSPAGTFGLFGYAKGKLLDWDFWEPIVFYSIVNAGMIFAAYRKQFPPPGTLTIVTVTQTDSVRKVAGVTETKRVTETETAENPEPPQTAATTPPK